MRVEVESIGVRIGSAILLDDASLRVPSGAMLGLLGPNGSGKSTLLRTLYRSLRPLAGVVHLDDVDLWSMPAKHAAKHVSVVTQDGGVDVELGVLDAVLMGRTPHKGPFAGDTAEDLALAEDALARVDAAHLVDRSITTLSGGERQRVLLARALTQAAPVLVLDEPTNHLDVCHQLELLSLVRELGVTTLVALHDLNLAHTYCDVVAVLDDGRVVATGTPAEVLTPDLLRRVFRLGCHTLTHPATGRPLLAFSEIPRAATHTESATSLPTRSHLP